jgi:hypothetical protein
MVKFFISFVSGNLADTIAGNLIWYTGIGINFKWIGSLILYFSNCIQDCGAKFSFINHFSSWTFIGFKSNSWYRLVSNCYLKKLIIFFYRI